MVEPVTIIRVAIPGLNVTLPEVIPVPVAGANVNVPVPTVPVKVKLNEVKSATPLTKSSAPDNLLVPDKPVIAPVNVVLTVILLELALKLVTVLPYASCAVKVFVPVKAVPFTCGLAKLTANLLKLAANTVTGNSCVFPVAEIVPSVVLITALSALYNTIDAVAIPLVNTTLVAVPKFVPSAVATVTGLLELAAPEKVKLFVPV
ncbi:hypothetical protein AQAU111925_13235 [Aquirufa aurantiipilula]